MSTNRKKTIPLSATSLNQLVTKHAKRVQLDDKATSSSKPTQQSNRELNTVSDRHSVPSDNTISATAYNVDDTVTAESYTSQIFRKGFLYYKKKVLLINYVNLIKQNFLEKNYKTSTFFLIGYLLKNFI